MDGLSSERGGRSRRGRGPWCGEGGPSGPSSGYSLYLTDSKMVKVNGIPLVVYKELCLIS